MIYFYCIISIIIFLQALLFSFFGNILLGAFGILENYYCAIKWPNFSALNYFITSVFSVVNFVFAIYLCFKPGIWYPIIISIIYFFAINLPIGTRLNPDLFLSERAKHGDNKALKDLEEIKNLRFLGRFML